MRASTASHCQKRTSNRRLGGGGIEREIKAKFYFHLKKIFFSVPTRMSVVLSRSAFCRAKRAIKPVQGCTGLITASKNRRCFIRAVKRISASIAVRNTTFPSFVCSSQTTVIRSVGREWKFLSGY